MRIPQSTGIERPAARNAVIRKVLHELLFRDAPTVVARYIAFQMLGVILASRNLDLSRRIAWAVGVSSHQRSATLRDPCEASTISP